MKQKLTAINYFVQDGKLYDREFNEIFPDENGFVFLNIKGQKKKFVYAKLVAYLLFNTYLPTSTLPTVKTTKIKAPTKYDRRGRPSKPKKEKAKPGTHRMRAVVAIKGDEVHPFRSSAEAARELKVNKNNIPHALSGKYAHVGGYQFKYA